MKKHLSILVFLCLITFKLKSQDTQALGRTYQEVFEHHKETGGVEEPKTTKAETGNLVLTYVCTDDGGIGKQSFSYFFNEKKVCTSLWIFIKNKDYGGYKEFLNKKYQYDRKNNVWVDNKNNLLIFYDDAFKELNQYIITYKPLYVKEN